MKKILAVMLSVVVLAGFMTAVTPAEEIQPNPNDPDYYAGHVCTVFIEDEKTLYVGLGDELEEKNGQPAGVVFDNHGTMFGPSDNSDFGDHNALWNEEDNDEDWEIGPQIQKVVFLDEFKSPTLSGWFESFTGLKSIEGLDKVDTAQTEDMMSMFLDCISLGELDLSSFDTANTEEMELMFALCRSLRSLDLSSFTVTENTRMNGMFGGCTSLCRLTLGENFRFSFKESLIESILGPDGMEGFREETGFDLSSPQLPEPPQDETYTGYWVLEGSDQYRFTSEELMKNYDGKTMAGAWVWELRKKSIADAEVVGAPQTYTGKALQSTVSSVTLNGVQLTEGEDFDISGYQNNINAGTATVTVTGKGLYEDSASGTFAILPASLAAANVSVADQIFSEAQATPPVTVTLGEKTLTEGRDFTVAYRNNGGAGVANAVVTGVGNYKDEASAAFTIAPRSLADAAVTVPDQLYTGEALTPAVTVVVDGITLTADTDYTVQYINNTEPNAGVALVTGKGNYTGAAYGTFRIKTEDGADFLLGDVDGNGKVEAADARFALRAAVGLDDTAVGLDFSKKTNRCFLAADVTKDKTIQAADARLILRAAVGLEVLS